MTKRYEENSTLWGEFPKVDAFLAEIVHVCHKHGFSISHEDSHGGFIIAKLSDDKLRWLLDASVSE